MKNISQTLAGRCAIFYLMPFSLNELRNVSDSQIADIGINHFTTTIMPFIHGGIF